MLYFVLLQVRKSAVYLVRCSWIVELPVPQHVLILTPPALASVLEVVNVQVEQYYIKAAVSYQSIVSIVWAEGIHLQFSLSLFIHFLLLQVKKSAGYLVRCTWSVELHVPQHVLILTHAALSSVLGVVNVHMEQYFIETAVSYQSIVRIL